MPGRRVPTERKELKEKTVINESEPKEGVVAD